jgi:hypothetical protein
MEQLAISKELHLTEEDFDMFTCGAKFLNADGRKMVCTGRFFKIPPKTRL